jgi:integrase
VLAKKRGHISAVPEFEWLPVDKPDFDYLTFDEAEQLVAGADAGQWRTMIQVAMLTGLRQGELLALRWDDVDLERRRLNVMQSTSRKITTSPKSRKGRAVELGETAAALLRAQRHLRGPFVFCDLDGNQLTAGECKHPLWRACRRAKLRRIGWHVLRHTYASHLAMLGASPKAIQEQLGHATLEMTMRYMHLAPATKAAAARLLDRPAQKLPDRDESGGT